MKSIQFLNLTRSLKITGLYLFIATLSIDIHASTKGLINEINNKSLDNNELTETSEIMISNSEIKAIAALENILQKKKGTEEEPQLLFRLSELYMRRSKTARFFEFYSSEKKNLQIKNSAKDFLNKSVKINNDILNRFPKFKETDSVLFNNAFIYHQLDKTPISLELYLELIQKFPNSPLKPDSLLAASDIYFQTKRFEKSLEMLNEFRNYKQHKLYTYSMYKKAWILYNLKKTNEGIGQLEELISLLDKKKEGFDLRKESIRDLILFTSEVYGKNEIIPFFDKFSTEDEYKDIIKDINNLYKAHSRINELFYINDAFLKSHPQNPSALQVLLYNADLEDERKEVKKSFEALSSANELCKQNSNWRKANELDTVNQLCNSELKHKIAFYAKKWWEKWEKNTTDLVLSDAVENSLKMILENNSDEKIEEALSEVLMKKEKYSEASALYKKRYFLTKNESSKIDLYYMHISALDKINPKNETELIQAYKEFLNLFKESKYHKDVIYNLSLLYFEKKDFPNAQIELEKIVNSEFDKQIFAIEMLAEIYNSNKEYKKTLNILSLKTAKQSEKGDIFEQMKLRIQAQISKDDDKVIDYLRSLEQIALKSKDMKIKIDLYTQIINLNLKYSLIDEAIANMELLKTISKTEYSKYSEILAKLNYLNGNNKDIIENKIEPFYSKIEYEKIDQTFTKKDFKKAFELSKKLLATSKVSEFKAKSRYIQARILEQEQFTQSLKTSADKFNLVFGMKMEKFDKSQSAYVSALQMADTAETKALINTGLSRCILEFTTSIDHLPQPTGIQNADYESLKKELSTVKNNIINQYKDVLAHANDNQLTEHNIFPEVKAVNFLNKNKDVKTYKAILDEINIKETRNLGLYHLGKLAESQNKTEKSLFIFEQLLDSDKENMNLMLEKEILSSQIQNKPLNDLNIEKFISIENSSTEFKILRAQYFFNKNDFKSVIKELSSFSTKDLYNLKIGVVLSKSLRMNNEAEKAKRIIKEILSLDPNNEVLQKELASMNT